MSSIVTANQSTAMATYPSLIQEIREALSLGDAASRPLLEGLARDYHAACTVVNARLRHCNDLLGNDFRSEAVRQTHQLPDLIESVQVLNFPGLPTLLQKLQAHELDQPPTLLKDIAEALEQADEAEREVEEFVRNHRLLALGGGPLTIKIRNLRELVRREPSEKFWRHDLFDFEKQRHLELTEDIKQAIADADTPMLLALREELIDRAWLSSPPRYLLKQVETKLIELGESEEVAEIRRAGEELRNAREGFDAQRAVEGLTVWRNLMLEAPTEAAEQLNRTYAEDVDWAQEQENEIGKKEDFKRRVGMLRFLLNSPTTTLKELNEEYLRLQRTGHPPPEDLEKGYRKKVRELTFVKRMLLLGSVGVSVIAILSIIAVLAFRML